VALASIVGTLDVACAPALKAPSWSRCLLVMKRIAPRILIVLGLVGGVGVVYLRLFSAGFVGFDDDIHVYANPFLNPPTLHNVARVWQQSYEQLYVPLAYTIFATIAHFAQVPAHLESSIGHTVSFDPIAFHVAGVAFHAANVLLCFLLVQQLTRRRTAALFASLVFALHPLQLESVAWISELRGLSSSFFALLALNALILSRRASDEASGRSRVLLGVSAVFVTCAMLCKPAAVVLPLVALAIDRIVLGTSWRRAMVASSIWAACAVPFALITSSVQAIAASGGSLWWQRPFIAGDAFAFYVFKTLVPIELCVDYGQTPRMVMSHGWAYLAWVVPVAVLLLGYRYRYRRPITWLGMLMFATFLLPTLGIVPFGYQGYSTVADRYAYLALIGVGLVIGDAVDHFRSRKVVFGAVLAALGMLAALSFSQSRHWTSSSAFLRHTIDVNPGAAFAYHNLGRAAQANGDYTTALANYQACLAHDPSHLKAYVNLAQVYAQLNQPEDAAGAIAQSMKTPNLTTDGMTAGDFGNLGALLMQMGQHRQAVEAFSAAAVMEPESPVHLFNQANALSAIGQLDKAEAVFRRCIALAPDVAGAHTGLGIVLAETHRLAAAADEFRFALRLQPDDPAALENLKRAESMLDSQGR
jgi:protein O-mannosyl-transferase